MCEIPVHPQSQGIEEPWACIWLDRSARGYQSGHFLPPIHLRCGLASNASWVPTETKIIEPHRKNRNLGCASATCSHWVSQRSADGPAVYRTRITRPNLPSYRSRPCARRENNRCAGQAVRGRSCGKDNVRAETRNDPEQPKHDAYQTQRACAGRICQGQNRLFPDGADGHGSRHVKRILILEGRTEAGKLNPMSAG